MKSGDVIIVKHALSLCQSKKPTFDTGNLYMIIRIFFGTETTKHINAFRVAFGQGNEILHTLASLKNIKNLVSCMWWVCVDKTKRLNMKSFF